MAKISVLNESVNKLMENLIHLFSTDRQLLENRGSLIIRQLSVLINPEKIYVTLARILEMEEVRKRINSNSHFFIGLRVCHCDDTDSESYFAYVK